MVLGSGDNTTSALDFAEAMTADSCETTLITTSEYPPAPKRASAATQAQIVPLCPGIDPYGLTPMALGHVDGFEISRQSQTDKTKGTGQTWAAAAQPQQRRNDS